MKASLDLLQEWMDSREGEHLEFKEAKNNFHFEKLVKYCAALANECGGRIILGVSDSRPRRVVGSTVFANLERTKAGLIERLRLRVDAEEILHADGRVLAFHVPSRPVGMPIQIEGAYWMRGGEDLVPMTPDQLKKIFAEAGPDYSAEVCPGASVGDLDPVAIQRFREMWGRKSGSASINLLSGEQLLRDVELLNDAGLTYGALVLFGKREALGRFLPQAEVIFEYRASEASGPAQQREEFRQGFFLTIDRIWELINLRNELQQFQEGLFLWDIRTFNEVVVREAILNAISHRDYRLAGSVFVRQYSKRLEIVSPGGFPPGVTVENILSRQSPRNRRLAEALSKCGLVERSGQGLNRIVEECIKESKARPDFSGTDDFQVSLTLRGEIQDPRFLRFLEKVGHETLQRFTTEDFLVLDAVFKDEPISANLRRWLYSLRDLGLIESIGRGRGVKYVLARQFYRFLGRKGAYTRRTGLDRNTNKELLVKHLRENQQEGSRLEELIQVLPALSRPQVQTLLRELRSEGRARVSGKTRAARWFPDGQIAS